MQLKRQRRVRPFFRPSRLEVLDDRTLLSGNVTALLNPTTGLLTIAGDIGNNRITIAPSPIAGDIRVSGDVVLTPPTGFDITTVNSVQFTDFVASSITSINITMQNGVVSPLGVQPNHSITINNLTGIDTVPGNLTINGGTANDTISISNYTTNGAITIAENSSATHSDKVMLTNVNVGSEKITTGLGSDILTLNTGKVGTMLLNTGGGAGNDTVTINNFPKVGTVSGIGLLSLTALSSGNDVLTVQNSSLTNLTNAAGLPGGIAVGGGNNTITLDTLAVLNAATVSAGGGNNSIVVNNTTVGAALSVSSGNGSDTLRVTGTTSKSLTVTSGTGKNVVTISNDKQTGTTGTTFSLTTGGVGSGTPQIITISNDQLFGGNATISAGDGPIYGFPPPPPGGSVLPAGSYSTFTASNFTGIGAATISLGNNFRNVTVGSDNVLNYVNAASLTVGVGLNSNVVLLNTRVAGAESITVGDMQNFGTTLLPPNSFILNGTAGMLTLNVGANAKIVQQNADVAGTESVTVGNNAGAVTIRRPDAGNSTILIGDNAAGPITISGNDTGPIGPWNELILIGGNAGGITVSGAINGNQTIGVGNNSVSLTVSTTVGGNQVVTVGTNSGPVTVSSVVTGPQSVTVGTNSGPVTVSSVVTGPQSVTVGSFSGPVTITGSAASANYTVGDNTSLSDSATSPGAVNIVGTTGDTIGVTSPSLGSLNVNTPGAGNTITVQGPLTLSNGGVTINSGIGATVNVDGVTATNDPSGNGVVINTGDGAISVQVSNTKATSLTINNGDGNTFLALLNDALGLGSVTPAMGLMLNSGNGNNNLFMSSLTVSNGLLIGFGSGVNTVYAAIVDADFGFIDGGSSGANTFFDAGGNRGFTVTDFVGF